MTCSPPPTEMPFKKVVRPHHSNVQICLSLVKSWSQKKKKKYNYIGLFLLLSPLSLSSSFIKTLNPEMTIIIVL